MNTERTEKFVNAIACDLEEGGFRQVSGTTLRRTLATAVSAALPLLADVGIPASQPAELAEQQGDQSGRIRELERLNEILQKALDRQFASAEEVAALALQQDDRIEELEEALAATGKQQAGEVQGSGLLPCPFCGGTAEFAPYKSDGLTLKCTSLGCVQRNQRSLRYGIDSLRDSMTKHWNSRALAARQPGAQEPVEPFCYLGWIDADYIERNRPGQARCVLYKGRHTKKSVPLFRAAPPAQGIDLRQQRPLIARSLAGWNEEDGNVMWWAWCGRDWAGEPAWCGTPNDSDWPGYHTHWTQHPAKPALIDQRDAAPGPRISQGTHDPSGVANG